MNQQFQKHNHRQFFHILDKGRNGKKKYSHALKLKDGKVVTAEKEKLERWCEHFNELLNVDSKSDLTQVNELKEYKVLRELANVPRIEEVEKAIKDLKCNKAAGPDDISAEMLKAGGGVIIDWLSVFFQQVWSTNSVPQSWKDAIMIPLHKKKEMDDCNNYRGIALLSIVGKAFTRLILNRIKVSVEEKLSEIQAAFRKDRSCIDQVFTLRMIIEKAKGSSTPVFICFVDLQKAYDSVDRTALWEVLEKFGFPKELIKVIKE